jgi:type IV pilus assembly protein PilA
MRKAQGPTTRRPIARECDKRGFSLIELLIVVAIILIIAAIAIPNLLRARISANEASAVASLRMIVTTNTQYYSTYGIGYAANLGNLGGVSPCTASSVTACLLDVVLTSGSKSGYSFVEVGNTPIVGVNIGFEANGTPQGVGLTGQRAFCVDQTGIIRFNLTGAAIGTGPGTCAGIPVGQIVQ